MASALGALSMSPAVEMTVSSSGQACVMGQNVLPDPYLDAFMGPYTGCAKGWDCLSGYWKHASCAELFSEQPPAWLTPPDGPDAGVTAQEWFPFCSLTQMEQGRFLNPGDPVLDILNLSQTQDRSEDLCAKPKQMRAGGAYVAPSVQSLKMTPMGQSDRDSMQAQFEKIRGQVKDLCCADGDADCGKLIAGVQLEWCQPQTDPDKADPCTTQGVNFGYTKDQWTAIYGFFKKYPDNISDPAVGDPAGNFPLASGRIELSPLLDKNGKPIFTASDIAHEMGHACSAIRRSIRVNQGDVDAFADFSKSRHRYDLNTGEPGEGCDLVNDATLNTYARLFGAVGASPDTLACLENKASDIIYQRFSGGGEGCKRGCPRQALEESFGDWMRFRATPANLRLPQLFPRTCNYMRDNEHPFMKDELTCFLRTPAIWDLARQSVGCQ